MRFWGTRPIAGPDFPDALTRRFAERFSGVLVKRDGSQAGRGFKVFSEVANCALCHLPPFYSDTLFHNVGVGYDKEKPDLGRGKIVADAAQKAGRAVTAEEEKLAGAFKTPSLRGVALSGPYFHDGTAKTLEEAVDYMIKGGNTNPSLDEELQPKTLTPKQRLELIAFLKSLSPPNPSHKRPALP